MIVKRPKLSFWENSFLPSILKGMWATLKHIPRRKVTQNYPGSPVPLYSKQYRGAPTLVTDPDGRVKCVACQLCEFVCPPKAIRITPGRRDDSSPDANVEKAPTEFKIDMLRCIYCGLCEEACPEEAIFLKQDCILTSYRPEELVLDKAKLLELGGVHDDKIWKWKNKG